MKKILVVVIAVAMMLTMVLAGCSPAAADTSGASSDSGAASSESAAAADAPEGAFVSKEQPAFVGDPEETYYLMTFLNGYDFWVSYYEGFMDAARQLGVNTKYMGAATAEIDEQVRVFEQIIAEEPAGIMVNPTDGDPFVTQAQKCNELGIPLVCGENKIPESEITMWIMHNEDLQTGKALERISEALGGSGQIAMLTTPGQENLDVRDAAFRKNVEEDYPGIEIVFEANTQHDNVKGAADTHQIANSYPDVKYIFCDNPDAAMGAVTAIQEGGYDIKVLTFDTNANVLDFIKEGKLDAAIMPDPYVFGYMGLMALYMDKHDLWDPMWDYKLEGGRPQFEIPLLNPGCTVVTAENVDAFYPDKYKEARQSGGYDIEAKDLTNPELPGAWEK